MLPGGLRPRRRCASGFDEDFDRQWSVLKRRRGDNRPRWSAVRVRRLGYLEKYDAALVRVYPPQAAAGAHKRSNGELLECRSVFDVAIGNRRIRIGVLDFGLCVDIRFFLSLVPRKWAGRVTAR